MVKINLKFNGSNKFEKQRLKSIWKITVKANLKITVKIKLIFSIKKCIKNLQMFKILENFKNFNCTLDDQKCALIFSKWYFPYLFPSYLYVRKYTHV